MTNDMPTAAPVPLTLREKDCAALRPMVASVESELASLQAPENQASFAHASVKLAEAWHRLVELMALGTEPEHRSCPHCQYRILVKATRCIQCWKRSEAGPAALDVKSSV
jgi:hypothetical protein